MTSIKDTFPLTSINDQARFDHEDNVSDEIKNSIVEYMRTLREDRCVKVDLINYITREPLKMMLDDEAIDVIEDFLSNNMTKSDQRLKYFIQRKRDYVLCNFYLLDKGDFRSEKIISKEKEYEKLEKYCSENEIPNLFLTEEHENKNIPLLLDFEKKILSSKILAGFAEEIKCDGEPDIYHKFIKREIIKILLNHKEDVINRVIDKQNAIDEDSKLKIFGAYIEDMDVDSQCSQALDKIRKDVESNKKYLRNEGVYPKLILKKINNLKLTQELNENVAPVEKKEEKRSEKKHNKNKKYNKNNKKLIEKEKSCNLSGAQKEKVVAQNQMSTAESMEVRKRQESVSPGSSFDKSTLDEATTVLLKRKKAEDELRTERAKAEIPKKDLHSSLSNFENIKINPSGEFNKYQIDALMKQYPAKYEEIIGYISELNNDNFPNFKPYKEGPLKGRGAIDITSISGSGKRRGAFRFIFSPKKDKDDKYEVFGIINTHGDKMFSYWRGQ